MVYLPPAFTETREEVWFAHLERHDFGLLVTHGPAGLIASQIPFVAERRGGKLYLQAHIARANPQADHLDGGEALAIFPGPHAYISPGWYEAGPAVPTWNYASVHAYGPARAKIASSRRRSPGSWRAGPRRNGPSRRRRAKAQAAARSGSGIVSCKPASAAARSSASTPFAARPAAILRSGSPRASRPRARAEA